MTSNVTIGLCCSKAKCTMPTRNVTFAHRCGSCDELMHAVCGKTDEDDVSTCFTCLDSVVPMKKRKLTSRGKNKEATTEKGRRSSAVAERVRGAKAKADADAAIKATPPHTPDGLELGGGSIAVYPSSACVLEKHCLAPTGAVVVQCPGCSSDIHPECGRFLTRFEGSKINGNMKIQKKHRLSWTFQKLNLIKNIFLENSSSLRMSI